MAAEARAFNCIGLAGAKLGTTRAPYSCATVRSTTLEHCVSRVTAPPKKSALLFGFSSSSHLTRPTAKLVSDALAALAFDQGCLGSSADESAAGSNVKMPIGSPANSRATSKRSWMLPANEASAKDWTTARSGWSGLSPDKTS